MSDRRQWQHRRENKSGINSHAIPHVQAGPVLHPCRATECLLLLRVGQRGPLNLTCDTDNAIRATSLSIFRVKDPITSKVETQRSMTTSAAHTPFLLMGSPPDKYRHPSGLHKTRLVERLDAQALILRSVCQTESFASCFHFAIDCSSHGQRCVIPITKPQPTGPSDPLGLPTNNADQDSTHA